MGLEQSKLEVIKDNWEPIGEILQQTPGAPTLARSILRPHLVGELYQIEMDNTNMQLEIATFKERRVNSLNVVGLFDFQVTKAFLGCARNASLYRIITERIPYRLNEFNHLGTPEIIYIFHEALNGYNELSKYKRLCYPGTDMIGIKDNGEVKVWTHRNWADNGYRRAKSESSSIFSLWSAIRIHSGDPDSLNKVNVQIDRLSPFEFEKLINFLRVNYSREILEGKFKLERRIKSGNFIQKLSNQPDFYLEMTRPRAYSENLKRPQTPFIVPNIQINDNQPLGVSQVAFHHTDRINFHQQRPPKPMSASKTISSKIYKIPFENSFKRSEVQSIKPSYYTQQLKVNFLNYNDSPKKNISIYEQEGRPSFQYASPTPITLEKRNIRQPKESQKNNNSNSSGKINFSYQNSQKRQDRESLNRTEKKPIPVNAWRDQRILNKNLIIKSGSKNQREQLQIQTFRKNAPFQGNSQKRIPQAISQYATVQPFELQLKLDSVIAKQGRRQTTQTYLSGEERQKISYQHSQNSSPIRLYNSGDSVHFQTKDPQIPNETDRDTKAVETNREEIHNSDSKQVAQEFKYYLRQSQASHQSPNSEEERQNKEIEEFRSSGLSHISHQKQLMEDNNSHCIIERWDEEESFYT